MSRLKKRHRRADAEPRRCLVFPLLVGLYDGLGYAPSGETQPIRVSEQSKQPISPRAFAIDFEQVLLDPESRP